MTAALRAVPYRSGWCGTGQHERCTGTYAGATCVCGDCDHKPIPPLKVVTGITPLGRVVLSGQLSGIPIVPLEPGTAEWYRTMSASKVAAVLGLSPYASRFSLWHRMAGHLPTEEGAQLRRGQYLEPGIVAWFADEHPDWTITPGGCWAHPDNPVFTASPDRLGVLPDGEVRGVEVKTAADDDEWGKPGTDEVPAGYRAQAMWQMHVTGTRITHFAVLSAFLQLREYVVEYDAADAAFIVQECEAFLATLPGGPAEEQPDLDSHNATYLAVRALHPDIDNTDVDLDLETARDYCRSRELLDFAKTAETRASCAVAAALGNGKRALYGGHVIAQRQARGGSTPFLVAGRSLPTFDTQESTHAQDH